MPGSNLVLRFVPVRRQIRQVRTEFKGQSRMTSGDQIMRDIESLTGFGLTWSDVAFDTYGRSGRQVVRVRQSPTSQFLRGRVFLPPLRCMFRLIGTGGSMA